MTTLLRTEHSLAGPSMPLFNSGNWNPDLHPRNSIGEFIYTDGGLHGRYDSTVAGTKKSPIEIPIHPANADVDANMRLMKLATRLNPIGNFAAFYLLVNTNGLWDYKNQPSPGASPQYQDFGNFNYGATGTAVGFDSYTLQNEAGRRQKPNSGGRGVPGKRNDPKSGIPPYGDLPIDNYWIKQGIMYAHQHGY